MVRAVVCGWVMLALLGCADGDPPLLSGVCDEQRPCAFGAVCVAGFCQPPPPDAARFDRGPGDGAPRPGPTDAAPDTAPVDRGPVDGPTAVDRGPPPDAGDVDGAADMSIDAAPDMAPPMDCGRFGQACCPGDVCDGGGCLDGICAAFGGVYAFGGIDGGCTAGNPLMRDRCQCPPGFIAHPLEDVDFDLIEELPVFHSVYVCAPDADDPAADLRGAFAEASDPDGAGCPSGCRLGPLQPACGCPDGTVGQRFEGVRQNLRDIPACPRSITLCGGAFPLTFGGAYRLWRPQSVACREIQGPALCVPNPQTGECSCPEGFEGAAVGMMAPHPTRGAPFYCHSDVVVCGARPVAP